MELCHGINFTSTWPHLLLYQQTGRFFNMNPGNNNVERRVSQGLRLCNRDSMFCFRLVSDDFCVFQPPI